MNKFLGMLLGILVVTTPVTGQESDMEQRGTRVLKELTAATHSGVAVLVSRDGKILFQGGAGWADREKQTPVTAQTLFRIGSVSKQFIAAGILKLVEQEKLDLQQTLDRFYPDWPNGNQVTLHHLLTHTSGLKSFTDKSDFMARVVKPTTADALIDWVKRDPPDFEPGKKFHYNNTAYFLLGEIITKASGEPWDAFLHEQFFKPLKMDHTGRFDNAMPPAGIALGYSFTDGEMKPAIDWDMSWAGGAGALYSTVEDLYRWNEAFFGGKVLNESLFKLATTCDKVPAGEDAMNYGYGLIGYKIKRLPVIGHSGGLHGWSSNLIRFPEQNCTVVVLTNAMPSPPNLEPQSLTHFLGEKVLADVIAKLPPIKEDPSIDAKGFDDYVGRYDYQGAIMTVTKKENGLFAQLTDQPQMQIYPKAKDEFFWKVVDAEVVFLRNEKGEVIGARHSQNGVAFTAPKLKADAVQLTVEQLKAFAGDYDYGSGATMKVTFDDKEKQLFAQLTGQPRFPIFPVAENEFEWRVVRAKVTFKKNKEGVIDRAHHFQNGFTIEAPKIKKE